MNRSCRGTLGPLLAVVYIAYSCSSLATAQNNAFGAAASAAIAEQSQHMQQQLNQQQVNQPLPLLMGKTLGLVRVRAVDLRYPAGTCRWRALPREFLLDRRESV